MTIAKRVCLGLVALALCGVAATFVSLWHSGYRAYIVHTGSMVPELNPGDLVIDKPVGHLAPGEVITFRHSDFGSDLVTHRIKWIRDGVIRTKGDANPTPDAWFIRPNQVTGVAVTKISHLGYLIVFLKHRAGVAAVMTGALSIIFLWGLFFPAGLADPTPTAARKMLDAAADASRGGISRLRGPGRVRRSEPGAVDALRATALTSTS